MPDPNKIEGGRWDRLYRSVFNLKGAGSTSSRIAEDISPTFNLPFNHEHQYLLGEKLLWTRFVSVGTVALKARCILSNVSENKLLITEFLTFSITTGGIPYLGAASDTQPFVAVIPIFPRDGRWGDLEVDQGLGTSQAQEAAVAVAPLPIIQTLEAAPGIVHTVGITLVLRPGDHFFLADAVFNHTLAATLFWREHIMEPTENA